jgi:hypothetical protein
VRAVLSEEHSLQQWLEIIIILWHSKSWWNQSYPQDSDVSTIVRTHYLIWLKRYPQDWSHTRLPDLVKNGTIYSWRNLTASNSNQTRSTFVYKLEQVWSSRIRHLNNLKELLFCQNHPRALRTSNTTWTHIQIQDSSFSFC